MNRIYLCLGYSLVAALCVSAREPTPSPSEVLLRRVSDRLVAAAEPPPGVAWPPRFILAGKGVRVWAILSRSRVGKSRHIVCVTPDLMTKVVRGQSDILAFLLANELARIRLGHELPDEQPGKGSTAPATFTPRQQVEADRAGVELLLEAGFSYRLGAPALERLATASRVVHEAKGSLSPEKRLALLDQKSANLWRTMPAFREGMLLLATERYPMAELCLERVVGEFPSCAEAWAGLGLARLAQYCDSLTLDQLRKSSLGMPVIAGFLERLPTLEAPLKGKVRRHWFRAMAALREALRQRPDAPLWCNYRGVAALVHPDGPDVEEALLWLEKAANGAATSRATSVEDRVSISINLGVVYLADKRPADAQKQFDRADRTLAAMKPQPSRLKAGLSYNRALLLSGRRDRASQLEACERFENYLQVGSPRSSWWPLAYDRYMDLSTKSKRKTLTQAQLQDRPTPSRGEVKLSSGVVVRPGQKAEQLLTRLAPTRTTTIVAGTNLKHLRFERHGIEVIATDIVIAVRLRGSSSPALILSGKRSGLRIGLGTCEVEGLLGRDGGVTAGWSYFPEAGVAVRMLNGKITELVLVERLLPENKELATDEHR